MEREHETIEMGKLQKDLKQKMTFSFLDMKYLRLCVHMWSKQKAIHSSGNLHDLQRVCKTPLSILVRFLVKNLSALNILKFAGDFGDAVSTGH